MACGTTERPYFPGQITSPDQLAPDMMVEAVCVANRTPSVVRLGIIAVGHRYPDAIQAGVLMAHGQVPEMVEDDGWMTAYRELTSGERQPANISLADHSVVPSGSGIYNSANYLRWPINDPEGD